MPSPGREPPRAVKRELRREIGFGCPVADCGNPYLSWHHFDPPWSVEHHHRPEGMIALCLNHAHQADNGAFTDDQLRELKRAGGDALERVGDRFLWMRQEVLARIGGNFYYRTPIILERNDTPCVWLNRDEDENILFNFRMPTISGSPRASITDNFWSVPTEVDELICPPMGRLIDVRYANGDRFRAEFSDITNAGLLQNKYPQADVEMLADSISFPVTLLEVWEIAAHTPFQLGPDFSQIGGVVMKEGIFGDGHVGIHVDVSDDDMAVLFPEPGE